MGVGPLEWAGMAVGLAVEHSHLSHEQATGGLLPFLSFETDATFMETNNGNSPTGDMGDMAFKRLKDQLTERVEKMRYSKSPLLLEGGLTAKPISTTGQEAQFHEHRLTSMEDIARIFGVPLSVVGLGRNSSYGSLAEESRALVQNCLTPWARRIEQELMRSLLTAEGRRQYAIEHDLSGLLRGDPAARFAMYREGIEATILSPNEARRMEGMRPREGGDSFNNPNTTPGGLAQEPAAF